MAQAQRLAPTAGTVARACRAKEASQSVAGGGFPAGGERGERATFFDPKSLSRGMGGVGGLNHRGQQHHRRCSCSAQKHLA